MLKSLALGVKPRWAFWLRQVSDLLAGPGDAMKSNKQAAGS